jgi:hypothetical protein
MLLMQPFIYEVSTLYQSIPHNFVVKPFQSYYKILKFASSDVKFDIIIL